MLDPMTMLSLDADSRSANLLVWQKPRPQDDSAPQQPADDDDGVGD